MKYISNLKKIVNSCISKGWLLKDPFLSFNATKQEVEREALTEQELKKIHLKVFPTHRLNYVKDIFLFSCYTGLAYADVKKLKRSEIGTTPPVAIPAPPVEDYTLSLLLEVLRDHAIIAAIATNDNKGTIRKTPAGLDSGGVSRPL